MEFAFAEEQLLLQRTVQQFALEKLLPNRARWDRGERFTKVQLKDLATLGVLGRRIPEQFGGQKACTAYRG